LLSIFSSFQLVLEILTVQVLTTRAPSKVSWHWGGKLSKSVKGRDPSYGGSSGEVEPAVVRLNLFQDFEGDGESAATVFEGNDRIVAGAYRVQKGTNFCV
jgi:hypothetical protein